MENTLDRDVSGKMTTGEFAPPFLLRLGAALIDYIILLIFPVGGLVSDRLFAGGLDIVTNETLWFIGVLVTLVNLIVLPLLFRQSIGKMLTGMRIVAADGRRAGTFAVLLRQTVGYLLTAATLGIGFFSSIFGRRARTLHDLITGTVVIRATRAAVSRSK